MGFPFRISRSSFNFGAVVVMRMLEIDIADVVAARRG
jgi:hypothetical protein